MTKQIVSKYITCTITGYRTKKCNQILAVLINLQFSGIHSALVKYYFPC